MDAKMVARGIADGISSIPGLMGRGLVRTWQGSGAAGDGLRDRNQLEPYIKFINSHPAMCRTIENELCKILPGKVRQVCGS